MLKVWLSLTLLTASAEKVYAQSSLIVPGERLGNVHLGYSQNRVHRVLGKPSLSRIIGQDVREESWLSPLVLSYDHKQREGAHWKFDFVNVYFQDGRVVQVETNAAQFQTRDGLSVRNKASQWKLTFGPMRERNNQNHPFLNPDVGGIPASKHFIATGDGIRQGIGWRYGFWANLSPDFDPASTLETIVVHLPGMPLQNEPDSYIRFVFTSRDLPTKR